MPILKKKKLCSIGLLVGIVILFQMFLAVPQTANAAYSRVAGLDRYQTAVAISQEGWKYADYVVLVKGSEFADALCAGPLAKKYNAPILFVETYGLNSYTQKEIQRLGATHAIIIGGYGAITGYVEQNLNTIGISKIERIYGSNRYETSVEIAKRLGTKEVALTTGNNYADALSISAIAAAKGFSILLTPPKELPQVVKTHLQNYKIVRTYIIGGTGAISTNIESQVPSPVRLSGKDRYDTNKLVMEQFAADIDFNKIYIATGEGSDGYADSLAGVVLAARTASPIVLNGDTIAPSTEEFIQTKLTAASYIVVLGGENAVSSAVVAAYDHLLAKVIKSVFSQPGTYGPASGTTTVSGSLAVESPNVIVRNTVIEGDLLLGENIGTGTVELNNVIVKGRTTVRGGGTSSIIGNVFATKAMVIDVPSKNKVAVRLKGKSKVLSTQLLSNAILDDSENTSDGFLDLAVERAAEVTIKGSYNTVTVGYKGMMLLLDSASIKTLNARSGETVYGTGTISTANISADGVVIYFAPDNTVIDSGYGAYIAGRWLASGTTKASDVTVITDLVGTAGNGTASLTFSAPTGASSVYLYQSLDGTTWTKLATSLSASSTTASLTGLTNGVTYQFKLAVTSGTKTVDSNVVLVTPVGPPITDLTVTKIGSEYQFKFSAAVDASTVVLEQFDNVDKIWVNSNVPTLYKTSTSVTVSGTKIGLVDGNTYYFRLAANYGSSTPVYSNKVGIGPINNLELEGTVNGSSVKLKFDAPAGATSVKLVQSTDNWATQTESTVALDKSSTSATVSGLTAGQTYYFKLIVTGGVREGSSNSVTGTL